MQKPRVIKNYENLPESILEQIKLFYPHGFERKLITFKSTTGKLISALPFETEDRYYLIRMTATEAKEIIEDEEDYNEDGQLKEDVLIAYNEKYEVDEPQISEEE